MVVYAGTSDMGQGARTVLRPDRRQELGAPLDWVTVVMGDTAIVPYDQQTSAVAVDRADGQRRAARPAATSRRKLAAMAARVHGVDEADVAVDRGVVRLPDGTGADDRSRC